MKFPYEDLNKEQLEDMLANHDCHLDKGEDSCDCLKVKQILLTK